MMNGFYCLLLPLPLSIPHICVCACVCVCVCACVCVYTGIQRAFMGDAAGRRGGSQSATTQPSSHSAS
jgi:hypothetical protein